MPPQGHHWGTGEPRFSVGQLRVELGVTQSTKDRSEATSIGTVKQTDGSASAWMMSAFGANIAIGHRDGHLEESLTGVAVWRTQMGVL